MDFFLSVEPFWYWLALGCLLMALELVLGSGFLLAIGTAAFVTSAVTFLIPGFSWLWACTLYAGLMVAAALAWWRFVMQRRGKTARDEPRLNLRGQEMIGRKLILEQDLKNGHGRVRLGDATWPVLAESELSAGTRVEITGVEGITLLVRPVEANSGFSDDRTAV